MRRCKRNLGDTPVAVPKCCFREASPECPRILLQLLSDRLFLCLLLAAAGSAQTRQPVLSHMDGQGPNSGFEIMGVGAESNPLDYWLNGNLYWVAEARPNLLLPRQSGGFRAISAPSVVEDSNGWRLFYSGQDGTPNDRDRVYSRWTGDFLDFEDYRRVLLPGEFYKVLGAGVQRTDFNGLCMAASGYATAAGPPRLLWLCAPDRKTWNGAVEPKAVKASEAMEIRQTPGGAPVLAVRPVSMLQGSRVLLFYNKPGDANTVWRADAASASGPFLESGAVQGIKGSPRDLRPLSFSSNRWALLLSHDSRELTYSFTYDGSSFTPERSLYRTTAAGEQALPDAAFVPRRDTFLGIVYTVQPALGSPWRQLHARWVQKRVVIEGQKGEPVVLLGAMGPDRVHFNLPPDVTGEKPLLTRVTVYAEDGVTQIGKPLSFWIGPGSMVQLSWK